MTKIPEITYDVKTELWTLTDNFEYMLPDVNIEMKIAKGFQTDLASIPRFFWRMIAPFELGIPAPIIHDFLYKSGGVLFQDNFYMVFTKKQVDDMFAKIMELEGVPWWKRKAAYPAVRMFGKGNFK